MRPGCDRPAAARVAFDPVALQLWLDPLARRSAPVQELCEFHVERLTIPRGWTATDRRPGTVASSADVTSIAVLEPVPAPAAVEDESHPGHGPVPGSRPADAPVVAARPEPEPDPEPVVVADPGPEPVVVVEPEPLEPEPEPVVVEEPEPAPIVATDPDPRPGPVVVDDPVAPSGEEPPARPAARVRPRPPVRSKGRRSESSLLSRAFELTGHQESILTRPAPDGADDASAPADD